MDNKPFYDFILIASSVVAGVIIGGFILFAM